LKAYNERKKSEAKLWQWETNTAAWLQGRYMMAAISHCFSKDKQYPAKPFEVFKSYDESEGEEPQKEVNSSDDDIRAQTQKLDRILAKKNQPPKEIIGKKRT